MSRNAGSPSVHVPEPDALDAILPGLAALRAEAAGDPAVCIALLDGPVDTAHPCFAGASLTLAETVAPHGVSDGPATRHGTHVASILFGQPGSPLLGIAPRCRGLLLPIFSDLPDGRVGAALQLDLARAILQAVALGANIINVSGGELAASAEADPYLANAVRLCAESGVLLVAAAGNDACECLHVPAALEGTLVVGAMDLDGQPLAESNWSAAYATRGVLAPGEQIPGADTPGAGLARRSGTSFAAPLVSGVAALLMAAQLRRGSRIDGRAVAAAILQGAAACNPNDDCRRLFRGRLDIPKTTRLLLKGGRTTMNENETTMGPAGEPQWAASGPGATTPASSAEGAGVLPSCGCGGKKESECSCKDKEKDRGAGCGCGGGSNGGSGSGGAPNKPVLAYALGRIGYDFATEARRDSFIQAGLRHPFDPNELLDYLDQNPFAAGDVTFTLEQDSTAIYGIAAGGPFAAEILGRLREFLRDQVSGQADTVSVPAYVGGSVRLSNGQTLPLLWPNIRGLYSWNRGALLDALVTSDAPNGDERRAAIGNFLDRVMFELRNLGIDPRERALNYAATNAFQVARVYDAAIRSDLALDTVSVERSPLCRPNSDCWDVKLTFFDPNQRLTRSRRVYRFTVDVSDILPVTIGAVRSFDVF